MSAPNMPADDLRRAVGTALLGDTDLLTLLDGPAIHDALPDRKRPPYVVIGRTIASDWSTATEGGAAVTLFLHVWTRGERRDDNQAIQAAVTRRLAASIQLANHHLVALRLELAETRRDRLTGHAHAVLRFRAVTEPIEI